jgi:hypothetical protein
MLSYQFYYLRLKFIKYLNSLSQTYLWSNCKRVLINHNGFVAVTAENAAILDASKWLIIGYLSSWNLLDKINLPYSYVKKYIPLKVMNF